MKTPVNAGTLKQHITYNWWKYLLIILVSLGLVDLLYSVTAYHPPREKTLGLYVYGVTTEEPLNTYLENVRQTEMPDMEEIRSLMMLVDDTYGPMQLMTYLAAGEGDLYLIPREQFLSYATSGSLSALDQDSELIALFDTAGTSLQSGWRRNTETGETHLYGIPQNKIPGLSQYAYAQEGFLCLPVSSKNTDNALKLLRILCRDMITEPQQEEQSPAEP